MLKINDLFPFSVFPGLYLRQVREPSLTDIDTQVLLCQYLMIYENQTLSLSTVVYMNGDSCVDSTATPVLMETLEGAVAQVLPVNLTIPLSDDYRSDILGAFNLDPTDDTFQR